MRGDFKGVFILFKLTSLPTHWGVPGEETGERAGGVGWGGWGEVAGALCPTLQHIHTMHMLIIVNFN